MGKHEALRREAGTRLARWLGAVERADPRSFTDIASDAELPAQALAESHFWCDEVFRPGANPHDAEDARRAYHLAGGGAPDLLRYVYTASGLALTMIEGRNFLLVQVDPASVDVLALPLAARAAAVHHVADVLFRVPAGGGVLQVPSVIAEGACFCSDEGADPLLLTAWHERVEGGIQGGRLYFLAYKKMARRVGFGSGERWFDDAWRRSARAAKRRRSPR